MFEILGKVEFFLSGICDENVLYFAAEIINRKGKGVGELKKRIGVALWGIPLLLFLSYMGGYFFLVLILVINGMALWEFYTMFRNQDIHAPRIIGVSISSLYLLFSFFYPQYMLPALIMVAVIFLLVHLSPQKGMPSRNTAFGMSGFLYITVLLALLINLVNHFEQWNPTAAMDTTHAGGSFVIVLLASIWICDTAAYFGGKKLGKHKLAPNISPNKTREGAFFGLVFGILSFYGIGKIFLPNLSLQDALVCGSIVGIFGQLGDLVESRFKRNAGVKDTSTLLPGHGGMLDRFDSFIFVSPFLWWYFYLKQFIIQ
ncbi:MAG: phosphatidate cytidylyltransferase [Calditrichaeota bacterium]|nr:MAG: phosphatidate cytidylyltransferase [Calditrichota bacterium]